MVAFGRTGSNALALWYSTNVSQPIDLVVHLYSANKMHSMSMGIHNLENYPQ